ncbi:Uncharacterised protein [Mycobacteroides abscessus subsp. abscessus]|nr:Uncharacterised protein [Mycobacteroides abscessus subsp. abscessus]
MLTITTSSPQMRPIQRWLKTKARRVFNDTRRRRGVDTFCSHSRTDAVGE